MSRVEYSPHIRQIIRSFIEYRATYFERLYSDTGIWWTDMIVDRYLHESYELLDTFIDAIEKDVFKWIYGTVYMTDSKKEYSRLVVKIDQHILIVWISRDRDAKTVYIDDLEIRT